MVRNSVLSGLAAFCVAGLLCSPGAASATVWVYVPDVSQIQYSTNGSSIYFRNLNQFNANALGCCWNYWLDTATPEGKNTFALFIAAAAQGKPMYFGVPNGYASGALQLNGIW